MTTARKCLKKEQFLQNHWYEQHRRFLFCSKIYTISFCFSAMGGVSSDKECCFWYSWHILYWFYHCLWKLLHFVENILHNVSRAIPQIVKNFIFLFLKPIGKQDIPFNISFVFSSKEFLHNGCEKLSNR